MCVCVCVCVCVCIIKKKPIFDHIRIIKFISILLRSLI